MWLKGAKLNRYISPQSQALKTFQPGWVNMVFFIVLMFFTSKSPLSFQWNPWFHLRSQTSSNLSKRLIRGSFHHSAARYTNTWMEWINLTPAHRRCPRDFFFFFLSEDLVCPIIHLWKEAFWYHLLNLGSKHHEIPPSWKVLKLSEKPHWLVKTWLW